MKKGFTLLELVVVILILGILATLGLTQYGRMIERSRGAEARAILGDIRKAATAYYMEHRDVGPLAANPALVGIGTDLDQIPSVCRPSHYFSYSITAPAPNVIVGIATRCSAGGKNPQGPASNPMLTLSSDVEAGTWDDPAVNTNPGGY